MKILDLKVEVPEIFEYDISILEKQLIEISKILINTNNSTIMEISKTGDPFACFSGDWGGDTPVEEYCNELRYSGTQTREIEPW